MPAFDKEQMLTELQTILLYEADHIRVAASPEIAEQFIGFSTVEFEEYVEVHENDEFDIAGFHDHHAYSRMEPSKVDLNRFAIGGILSDCFDFAFTPSLSDEVRQEGIDAAVFFMQGIPRIGTYGETLPFMSPNGFCQIVADVAAARWRLEVEEAGTFTAREIAFLANMTEGAVRNAMTAQGEGGLKTILGKKPLQVEWAEADRWLRGRRGFTPIPRRPSQDQVLKDLLKAVTTAHELGQLIWRHNLLTEPEPDDLWEPLPFKVERIGGAAALGWSPEEFLSWQTGTFKFDAGKAQELAKALDFDVHAFVGKALEVSLRRDAEDQR